MARRRQRLDPEAAGLEVARDDLDAELVLVLDVVAVRVRAQHRAPAVAPQRSTAASSGSIGAPLSTNTAVPPSSSATTYAFER